MATFDELMERALEAPTWVKGIETFARLISAIDYRSACNLVDVSWDAYKVYKANIDNGNSSDVMKLHKDYAWEIWQRASAQRAWLEERMPDEQREKIQNARRRWK